jgi:arylsulfatase A-like enzyme
MQATEKYLNRFPGIEDPKRKTYAAMVSAVDDGVGLILNKLTKLNISDNTIVIFLSDNGGPKNDNASNNAPLRGGKGSLYEGGIRVPFAMQWPKKITANTEYLQPVISLDIFATVAANIEGLTATKNKLDGVDLLPYLKGTNNGSPHEYLFWRQYDQKNYAVVHASGYKELILRDSVVHMYNLKTDIGEQKNVLDKNADLFQRIHAERKKWESATVAPAFLGLNQEEQYEKKKNKAEKTDQQ